MERWLANHFSVYLKDSDECKAVRDFCLLWAVFEGSLFDGHWSVESGRRVVGNLELGGIYGSQFRSAREYFRERYLTGENHEIHWDLLGVPITNRDYLKRCLRGQRVTQPDEATSLLIIAWRLRANLFHGDEWRRGCQEPLLSFHHAGRTIMRVLEAVRMPVLSRVAAT